MQRADRRKALLGGGALSLAAAARDASSQTRSGGLPPLPVRATGNDDTRLIAEAVRDAESDFVAGRSGGVLLDGIFHTTDTIVIRRAIAFTARAHSADADKGTQIRIRSRSPRPAVLVNPTSNQIIGGEIGGFGVDGGGNCDALALAVTAPYVIGGTWIRDLWARNVRDVINGAGVDGNVIYSCVIERVMAAGVSRYGLRLFGASYNRAGTFNLTEMGRSSVPLALSGVGNHIDNFATDGFGSRVDDLGGTIHGYTVETIHEPAERPLDAVALWVNGDAKQLSDLHFIELSDTRCGCAVKVSGRGVGIDGLRFTTTAPSYGLLLDVQATGTLRNASGVRCGRLIEEYVRPEPLQAWQFQNAPAITTLNDPLARGPALPTATAAWRGRRFHLEGARGQADASWICRKRADERYEWSRID